MPTHERNQYILAITIEGVGIAGANDRLIRWATGSYQGDADGAYVSTRTDGLKSYPSVVDANVDLEEGLGSTGGQSFELHAGPTARSWFSRLAIPAQIGIVTTETVDDAAFNLDIQTDTPGDLTGVDVVWEREVIRLGTSFTGSGPYRFTGCTRGRWGSTAAPHDTTARRGTFGDPQLFLASHFPVKLHRVVTLIRVPMSGTSYDDEEILWRGVMRGRPMPDLETITIEADDALDLVRNRTLLKNQFTARRQNGSNFTGQGGPVAYQGASSKAVFMLDDTTAVIAPWSGDLATHPTQTAVTVDATAGTSPIIPGAKDPTPEELDEVVTAKEVLTTHPSAPAINTSGDRLGSPGGTTAPHVVDLIRQYLQSSQASTYGARGSNGTYDLGIECCGIPSALIDTDSFGAMRDELGPLGELPRYYLTEPTGAGEEIQRLLMLAGLALTRGADFGLALTRTRSAKTSTAIAITQADLADDGEVSLTPRDERIVDTITAVYDEHPGIEALRQEKTDQYRIRRYPTAPKTNREADLRGLGSSRPHAEAEVGLWTQAWLERWRYHPPEASMSLLPFARFVSMREGDIVTLTHEIIPDEAAELGIESLTAQVTNRSYDIDGHRVDVDLLLTGWVHSKTGLIAPGAKVNAVSGTTITVGEDFCPTKLPGQLNDTFGFETDWKVQITSRDRGTIRGTATLTAVDAAASTLTVDAMPAGVVVGDLVELADYDDVGDATDTYAFMADSNGTLGAANSPAYEWT